VDSPDTPRWHSLKLIEEALELRVDGARAAFLVAKQNFMRARLAKDSNAELRREREFMAATAEARALENLLTAAIDLNAFIFGEMAPKHLPAQPADLLVQTCRICGTEVSKEIGTVFLCDTCDKTLHVVPLRAGKSLFDREKSVDPAPAPRSHYLKLMEDALQSRVNQAREALLTAKLEFSFACQNPNPDPEISVQLEGMLARAQERALAHLRTAVNELNAFLLDGTVPKDQSAPAPAADLQILADGSNITGRRKAQAKLEHQAQLSTIYESVSDALFMLSVEGVDRYCFLTVNQTFLRLTGLAESQVRGKYLHEVIPPDSLPAVLEHYRRALTDRTNVRWKEVSVYPAGTKHGEVIITPIFDDNSRCTSIVGAVRDLRTSPVSAGT
jgi:PAS domain S-box-containing protein